MLFKSKPAIINATLVLSALISGIHAQDDQQPQAHPEEIVMTLPEAEVDEEYVTMKDRSNIFNAVRGTLDASAAAAYSSGMSAMPATLPKQILLTTWNSTAAVEQKKGPMVYTVANVHTSLADCASSPDTANLTTVKTTRAWKLLYFDGSNDKRQHPIGGSLASYLYESAGATNATFYEGLCQWIDGKYDGFIMLEDTLKIVQCQGEESSSELYSTTAVPAAERAAHCETISSGTTYDYTPSTRSDYLALTGLRVHWDYAISAYGKFLPGVADEEYPTINATLWDKQDKYYFDDELTMIAEVMIRSDLNPTKVNWQAHVDAVAQMYAQPLLALTSATYDQFVSIIHWLVQPSVNAGTGNSSALEVCINRHLPDHSILKDGTPTENMLYEVLNGTTTAICSVMLDLYANMTTQPFIASQTKVLDLQRDLRWSEFKQCRPACDNHSRCIFNAKHDAECVLRTELNKQFMIDTDLPASTTTAETVMPTLTTAAKAVTSDVADQMAKRPSEPIISASPDAALGKDEL